MGLERSLFRSLLLATITMGRRWTAVLLLTGPFVVALLIGASLLGCGVEALNELEGDTLLLSVGVEAELLSSSTSRIFGK